MLPLQENQPGSEPGKMPYFLSYRKETQKAPPGFAGANLSDMLGSLRRQHLLVVEIFTLHRAGHIRNLNMTA